jgi:thiol-disulfide isomerase/thioredoxin
LRDNNNDNGYYTVLYNKAGKVVLGSHLALANAFSGAGMYWDLKRNKEKTAELARQEFGNPAAKTKFTNEYLDLLSQSAEPADKELLKEELARQLQKQNLSEGELAQIRNRYQGALANKEKAAEITALIKERFPEGAWKRDQARDAFYKEKGFAGKAAAFQRYVTGSAATKNDDHGFADYMAGTLARMAADSGDISSLKNFVSQISNAGTRASTLNAIAWKLAGGGMSKKPVNVDLGLELSAQAMEMVNAEMKDQKNKQSFLTAKQYSKNLANTLHSYADTYGVLLAHKGDHEKAYEMAKKSADHFKRKNMNINENFALLTEKVKGPKEAQAELESFLQEGKHTPAMKEQLKTLYLAANNTDAQWAAYVNALEETAYNKLKAEMSKKMINIPAPQFALKDLNGKEVALASLKGKVVVVDFWATWCGPCIASFPGMQKAAERFKSNPDVVFLFIDTWENDSNRVQKVTDFMAKNKYDFTVLYDVAKSKEGNDFVVIEDYQVDGIPTKFVIDRNNNIRFKSVGYNGSADATVNEMTAMIDIAAAESGEPLKKAF